MTPALLVLGYAVVIAAVLPLPLGRLSEPGATPRLGLTAWLLAMGAVLASALTALALLARTVIAGWPAFARTVCESVTSQVCPPTVYRSAAYELGLALAVLLGGALMMLLTWRYGRSLARARRRTRAHGEAARITGRPVGAEPAAFVLDAAQPAAYCVPGRPPTIVLTTGALDVLGPEQLTAVLAHERAHLAGRHHLLLALTRSLGAVAPAVPLFARGTAAVARLAEMRADDVAARRGDPRTLLAALLAMGAGSAPSAHLLPAPAASLAATGGVVAARASRLSDPAPRASRVRNGLALAALSLATAATCALVLVLAIAGR